MTDRIEEFVVEAREHLGLVEESLLALEKQSNSIDVPASVDRCFRSIHSIKGDSGFLGLARIHELAHAMETLLSAPALAKSPRAIEVLLTARDRLAVLVDDVTHSHLAETRDILSQLAWAGSVVDPLVIDIDLSAYNVRQPGGLSSLIRQTVGNRAIREGRIQFAPIDLRGGLPTSPVRWMAIVETTETTDNLANRTLGSDSNRPRRTDQFKVDLSEWSKRYRGLIEIFRKLQQSTRVESGNVTYPAVDVRRSLPVGPVIWSGESETTLSQQELVDQFGFELSLPQAAVLLPRGAAGTSQTPAQPPLITETRQSDSAAASSKAVTLSQAAVTEKSTSLRIQVELLDRMMTLVGELTLVRNQALLAFAEEDGRERAIIQRLNSVTSELQDVTLRARMQPVGNLFNKFPRMVRDLARQLGKQVEIELQGRDVELDKTILEQLSDPLMHLVRNSVDHGIELPDDRAAKGKSPIGRIVLSAAHEDGLIQIQIRDDGKGIDPHAVKAKALSLGLKSEAELNRMSQRELHSLILLPGFSTAKTVTEVSGRGVGMDVVKTNIEHLEGSISIDSEVGQGCSVVLRLPLTLAIIPCLIVTVGDQRFAVPQRDLEEVVCLHHKSSARIEQAFDTEVCRLRNQLLPIVRLAEVLNRKQPFTPEIKAEILAAHASEWPSSRIQYILVLSVARRRFGLLVDDVQGTHEIVVKPMHLSMKRVGIFTAATIMGDGQVALITDAHGIVEHAQLSFEAATEAAPKSSEIRDAADAHRVLLFEYGPEEQFALPLVQIRRVVIISPTQIERAGDQEYITVEGVPTRVVRMNQVTSASSLESDPSMMSLILPKFVSQPIGILVSKVVDTESLGLDLQHHAGLDQAILGSAVVQGRLTLFLEMHRLCERMLGTKSRDPAASAAISHHKRLLFIDDTAFFREVVKRYLAAEGYEIVIAVDGAEGLRLLDRGCEFDLIISDIEMPVMDGWEFAREVRRREIATPMLALTTLSGTQYEAKARECGYDGYEVKLDHDRLVRKVGDMLATEGALT